MTRRRDPAPSRAQYRLQRLLLRPAVRRTLKVGPAVACVVALVAYAAFSSSARQAAISVFGDARAAVVNREEFRVGDVAVYGASPALKMQVEGLAKTHLPMSSLEMDLQILKKKIEEVPAISNASVRVGKGGMLTIDLKEREPRFVWRVGNKLHLLDEGGVPLGNIQARSHRPLLPLVIGPGADRHLAQAERILASAEQIAGRVRALQRIGGRRWNLLLDRDQVLMLPEENPVPALLRIMALAKESDILNKDVTNVDFRDPVRPTLRMGPFATAELRRLQESLRGAAQ